MIDVCIPFRPATAERQRLHDYTQALWALVDYPHTIHVAADADSGPFNFSRGFNNAYRMGTADHVLVWGADHVPPTADELHRITTALEQHPWHAVYAKTRELTRAATAELLDAEPGSVDPRTLPHGAHYNVCTGIVAATRTAILEAGGMDEGYEGWGYEDNALRAVLDGLYGPPTTPPQGVLTTLFHDRAPTDNRDNNAGRWGSQRKRIATDGIHRFLEQRGSYI